MPYAHNPIGGLVIQENPATFDREGFLAHLEHTRPYCYGFLQDAGLMHEALQRVPELKVAWLRTYRVDEEKEFWRYGTAKINELIDAHLAAADYLGFDLNRGWLYVGNEPAWDTHEKLSNGLAWDIAMMQEARRRGVHCVMTNFGVATVSKAHVDSGIFDDYLREFSDGWHIMGAHEYGGPVEPAGAAGRLADMYLDAGLAQPERWPSPYDVQVGSIDSNWLIGCIFWWFVRCDTLGIPRPRTIITECGADRLNALENVELSTGQHVNIYQQLEQDTQRWSDARGQYDIVPWPHSGMRGWQTLKWLFENYYGQTQGWSWQRTCFEMTKWRLFVYDDSHDVGYGNRGEPTIEAVCYYAWCPGTFWDTADGFDLSTMTAYHQLTVDYVDAMLNEPSPEPEPTPNTPAWLPLALAGGAFLLALIVGLVYVIITQVKNQSLGVATMEIEELLVALWNIPPIAVVSYTATVVMILVEVWKRYLYSRLPEKLQASPQVVAVVLVAFFLLVHSMAANYAYDDTLREVVIFITKVLDAIGPYFLTSVLGLGATNWGYNKLRGSGTPGFIADNPAKK